MRYLLPGLLAFSLQMNAQSGTADINVQVTNTQSKPLKGQIILFTSAGAKPVQVVSDAEGKARLKLTAGRQYGIRLKTFTDTADYAKMDIPALAPGASFSGPFNVNIQYEPARHFRLDHVLFETGKATLLPASVKELEETAEYMRYRPDEKFEIEGHTDNVGKPEDNLKLSQARADAVRNWLLKKGIQPEKLVAKGYGDTKPVADNATAEGRQLNRRTELRIVE